MSLQSATYLMPRFHSIFVIDRSVTLHLPFSHVWNAFKRRSGSMCQQDRQPLHNAAGIERITPIANDRLGCVFSALYSFWLARQAAIDRNAQTGGVRRDTYSLIFFNHEPSTSIENDLTGSPDELLTAALQFEADGGTDFTRALERTQSIMDAHWSTERWIFWGEGSSHYILTRTIERLS